MHLWCTVSVRAFCMVTPFYGYVVEAKSKHFLFTGLHCWHHKRLAMNLSWARQTFKIRRYPTCLAQVVVRVLINNNQSILHTFEVYYTLKYLNLDLSTDYTWIYSLQCFPELCCKSPRHSKASKIQTIFPRKKFLFISPQNWKAVLSMDVQLSTT